MNSILPTTAKWTFTTRRVNKTDIAGVQQADINKATNGDLVLAKVVRIGSHKRCQLSNGRNSSLHIGDHIVLCCGARYAPDQFEGIASVSSNTADMLAGGGVIGKMRVKHGAIKNPTKLQPIGLLTEKTGEVVNVQRYGLAPKSFTPSTKVIAVTGAAMNSGKTTTAFSLVNGLVKAGLNVAAVKITGTGAFGDFNAFLDAGAFSVTDFTDAGMATTYRQPLARILESAETLLANAQDAGADVIVVELGDGVLQQEAAKVLSDGKFQQWLTGLLFAAPDALSAHAAIQYLNTINLPVMAVSGVLTRSPLLCKEFSNINSTPLLTAAELSDEETALTLVSSNISLFSVA